MEIIKNLTPSWQKILKSELKKPYLKEIEKTLEENEKKGIIIYPKEENIFKAFEKTPFSKIKIVILGQDPYHGEGQAQGFCFSVPEGTKFPPSLRNIFKELQQEGKNGDLTSWTEQGVFLLNSILTVQAGKPASHSKIGWEFFTDSVIKNISDKKNGVIFLLWGAFAQSKKKLIDESKHIILETTHPSPFSAYRSFLGSNCFKDVNNILKNRGEKKINWNIKSTNSLF
ncbi:MAG: uracil-DNA glycosylase [Candidatus Gracilibacteria bacterium]